MKTLIWKMEWKDGKLVVTANGRTVFIVNTADKTLRLSVVARAINLLNAGGR